jgi:hypothetical protein
VTHRWVGLDSLATGGVGGVVGQWEPGRNLDCVTRVGINYGNVTYNTYSGGLTNDNGGELRHVGNLWCGWKRLTSSMYLL